mmetsp:Transcript_60596/g.126876  ORF Transcript_60596/g.126876 Transcript_60596/m.126876 type:complete len:87 (-) Transcript_60596:2412-2672(-)
MLDIMAMAKPAQVAELATNLRQNKMNAQLGVLLTHPAVFATKDIKVMVKPVAFVFKVHFSMGKAAILASSALLTLQRQMNVLLEAM